MEIIEGFLTTVGPRIENFLIGMIQPWRIYQIVIMLVLFAIAHFAENRLGPRIDAWMRSHEGLRPSQLRLLIAVGRRVRGIIFVALLWLAVWILRANTWPSRSYLIDIVANLGTAWLIVAIASRVIRHKLTRQAVRWGIWVYLALLILGQTDEAYALLDSIALSIGSFRISVWTLLKGLATLIGLMAAVGWLNSVLKTRLERVEDLSPSIKVLTEKMVRLILYGIAVVVALQSVGFDLTSITVLSGAIGLGIGFGLQKVVSNLISGLILLMDKSIKPGDVISLGDTFGWISDLGARYVSVVTRDGREYLIPNEDLITGQVVNWSHSSDLVRLDIHFGVSYDSDPHEVRKIAREAAGAVKRVVNPPAPVCHITGFGASSVDFILRFWIRDPSAGLTNIRGDVFLALWDALHEHNIDIPFPRTDVAFVNAPPVKD
ncbi:MAG TPA: mechanosensitive ion channel domain-containing protein [Paracoccaceae bacterium]|nr:mechanosensitive ion channel domain-containing protein [Paracoccaceae bacterium]